MKVYRTSDKIEVKVGELELTLSPLSLEQKMNIQDELMTGNVRGAISAAKLAVKYSLKSIKGLVDQDDQQYQLEHDASGVSDECLEDIFNIELKDKLSQMCLALINGVPKKFLDNDDNPLEGVEIIHPEVSRKKEIPA